MRAVSNQHLQEYDQWEQLAINTYRNMINGSSKQSTLTEI